MAFLIAAVIVLLLIVFLILITSSSKTRTRSVTSKVSSSYGSKKKLSSSARQKNRKQIIKDCGRKLSQNPHDISSLTQLGELYFEEHLWDKAYPLYDSLGKLAAVHQEIDIFKSMQRAGVCAAKLNKSKEAIENLTVAYKINSHDFETNYYLGQALMQLQNYDKAVPCFKKALVLNNDAQGLYFLLGHCLYQAHHFHESLPYLKKALDENPDNKEALFEMADAMSQDGHGDKAMKVFMHLRPDPVFGARSCLQAGLIHSKNNDNESAIQDFTIGLKHEGTPLEVKLELRYRLANCLFAVNKISQGLQELKTIQSVNSQYKDVSSLISRYAELSSNSNLQTYLVAGTSDFVALCRKIVIGLNSDSNVKFIDINVGAVYTDITAHIDNVKWEDTEIFRFFRTTGLTGEIYLRDFHGTIHDLKVDKGVCITAGTFTEEAHKFIDGRPIDLIEKPSLAKLLKKID